MLLKTFLQEASTCVTNDCSVLCHSKRLLVMSTILAAVAFVKIPQQLLLHAGLCCFDCQFGQAFNKLKAEAGVAMDDRHLLCLLLIVERAKGMSSEWHPYISYLPQTYGAPPQLHLCAAAAFRQLFQS